MSTARIVLQVVFIIVAVAAGLWGLHRLASLALILVLAALFAYVIAPLVELAEHPILFAHKRHRLPRPAAIAIVYLLIAGSASAGAAILLPSATQQVEEIVARTPAYAQSIVAWEHGWSRYYARLRMPAEVRQAVDRSVVAAGGAGIESAKRSLLALGSGLASFPWLVLVPVLAFFLLKDGADFRRTIVKALPSGIQLRVHRLFEDLNATLAAYIRAQLLACALVGTVCGIGFAAIGVPYPVVLGVLAGVLEFIPFVGPLVLAIVATIAAALHAPMIALSALLFLAVLRIVQDYVVFPRLIRRSIDLHPFAAIVAVLAGAELDGVAGMFLAVPTVAIASVVYRHWLAWRTAGEADAAASLPAAPAARA